MGSVTEADILYYQPKVSLVTNRVVGAEGLARWRRQDGSVAAPGAFMPAVPGTCTTPWGRTSKT
jgi:sensor c-di-GMP phosphodiesterase-like protein